MMTISTFKSAPSSEPTVGTVFAKIVKGTRHVDGDHLLVEDFSGTLEVWVPRSLHHRGTGVNKWFAFDVLSEPEPCAVVDLIERSIIVSDQRTVEGP